MATNKQKILLSSFLFFGASYGLFASLKSCSGNEVTQASAPEGPAVSVAPLPERKEAAMVEMDWPLPESEKREKKLTFGLYVTPEENPISPPERFSGYHAGLDLEILPEETEADVPVFASCSGKVLGVGPIDGYGGVILQSCLLENGEEVTVLYGHIDSSRFSHAIGEEMKKGEEIAILAPKQTAENGYTRKHLHFAIRKGIEIEVPGYLDDKNLLEDYLDPRSLLEKGRTE